MLVWVGHSGPTRVFLRDADTLARNEGIFGTAIAVSRIHLLISALRCFFWYFDFHRRGGFL